MNNCTGLINFKMPIKDWHFFIQVETLHFVLEYIF